MVRLASLYADSVGFGIRDCEPEFDDSGELTGFVIQSGEDWETDEEPLTPGDMAPLMDSGDHENPADVESFAERLLKRKETREAGKRILRRLKVAERSGGYGVAGPSYTNRYSLADRAPITEPEAMQYGSWDADERESEPGGYYGNLSPSGAGKVERKERESELRRILSAAPRKLLPALKRKILDRYRKSVQSCLEGSGETGETYQGTKVKRIPNWDRLFLTREQRDSLVSYIDERLARKPAVIIRRKGKQ